jgi:WD40 repeat protein
VAVAFPSGNDHLIRVLDVSSGKELLTLAEHTGAIRSLAFHADNRTLVSAGADKSARLLDIGVVAVWEAHPGGVTAAAFHSNGTQALTGGADKSVKLWDLAGAKMVRAFGPLADPISDVTFNRDFTQVGAAAGKTVKVWNLGDGKELLTLSHPADVTSLSFSVDKAKLVTGAADNFVRVWDTASGKELQSFGHAGPVRSVVFHPNNTTVLSGSADKTVAVNTLSAVRVIPAAMAPVRGLALIPAATHVLAASDDKTVKLLNLSNGAAERTFTGMEGPARAVAVTRNAALVAVGGAEPVVRLFNFADGKPVGTLKAPAPVRGLAFSPNNQTLAAACEDKSLATWNVVYNPGQPPPADFGKPLQTYTHGAAVADVVFAPDSVTFYSASADKTARAWKFASDAPTKSFAHPNFVDTVAFNPAGNQLATGCHDGIVRIWDIAKSQVLKPITAYQGQQPFIYSVAWSPDGKQVACSGYDPAIKLFDATGGALVKEFKGYKEKESEKGHRDSVFSIAFSPDGKLLASGSTDYTIKLWNVADGSVVREFVNPNLKPAGTSSPTAHPGWVYSLRFTPDGKYLVSAGSSMANKGYLAVWSVADGKLLHGQEMPLGVFYSVALSPDGKRLAIGAGPHSRPPQELNQSYILKVPVELK